MLLTVNDSFRLSSMLSLTSLQMTCLVYTGFVGVNVHEFGIFFVCTYTVIHAVYSQGHRQVLRVPRHSVYMIRMNFRFAAALTLKIPRQIYPRVIFNRLTHLKQTENFLQGLCSY